MAENLPVVRICLKLILKVNTVWNGRGQGFFFCVSNYICIIYFMWPCKWTEEDFHVLPLQYCIVLYCNAELIRLSVSLELSWCTMIA